MTLCGELVLGAFEGTSLPRDFALALSEGRRGGVILFKRNVEGGPAQVAALARAIHVATAETALVAVDQEGGRVARLRAPLLVIPPMRTVAAWGDTAFAERIARAVAAELAVLGFTLVFAPVLDVNTSADNPVIGDRAFGDDPDTCARFGVAWIQGIQRAGLLACGKHFPGHGDTTTDSHTELPVVHRSRDHIDRVGLKPFRAAASAGVASMMTAHVVYTAIDPRVPATLSRAVCTDLRAHVGFGGLLFSDDLVMRAIADRWPIEEAAVLAIAAGCDALLVCSTDDKQERAVQALTREAHVSPAFRARCELALGRLRDARRRIHPPAIDGDAVARVIGGAESRAVATEIARRLEA
ncbi:MAG: beta-N-acetylhexosaminidase [Myxococcota bacterium]|nr:beta-N-acetylhexosaminidase [Myxococcota bacterium]